jgi:hypothetical protein
MDMNASSFARVLPCLLVLAPLAGACVQDHTIGSDPPDGSTTREGGALEGGGASEGGTSDGRACVTIELSSYDRSCKADKDCTTIASGTLCSGGCACGDSAINASGEATYVAAIKGIASLACPCPAEFAPVCDNGVCTPGPGFDAGSSDAGDTDAPDDAAEPPPTDSGAPDDAPMCVEVDLADYDVSCTKKSDCIDVTAGMVCSGACACGGSAINVADQAKYTSAVAGIHSLPCPCAYQPIGCVAGKCTQCSSSPDASACDAQE